MELHLIWLFRWWMDTNYCRSYLSIKVGLSKNLNKIVIGLIWVSNLDCRIISINVNRHCRTGCYGSTTKTWQSFANIYLGNFTDLSISLHVLYTYCLISAIVQTPYSAKMGSMTTPSVSIHVPIERTHTSPNKSTCIGFPPCQY